MLALLLSHCCLISSSCLLIIPLLRWEAGSGKEMESLYLIGVGFNLFFMFKLSKFPVKLFLITSGKAKVLSCVLGLTLDNGF